MMVSISGVSWPGRTRNLGGPGANVLELVQGYRKPLGAVIVGALAIEGHRWPGGTRPSAWSSIRSLALRNSTSFLASRSSRGCMALLLIGYPGAQCLRSARCRSTCRPRPIEPQRSTSGGQAATRRGLRGRVHLRLLVPELISELLRCHAEPAPQDVISLSVLLRTDRVRVEASRRGTAAAVSRSPATG